MTRGRGQERGEAVRKKKWQTKGGPQFPVHNEANRQPTVNQQLNSCPASTTTMKNPILWKKIQAVCIWVTNNTQKYAQCVHGSSNTPLLGWTKGAEHGTNT